MGGDPPLSAGCVWRRGDGSPHSVWERHAKLRRVTTSGVLSSLTIRPAQAVPWEAASPAGSPPRLPGAAIALPQAVNSEQPRPGPGQLWGGQSRTCPLHERPPAPLRPRPDPERGALSPILSGAGGAPMWGGIRVRKSGSPMALPRAAPERPGQQPPRPLRRGCCHLGGDSDCTSHPRPLRDVLLAESAATPSPVRL